MNRKVIGVRVVLFGVAAIVSVVTSPQLQDVAWRSAVVVVVKCSGFVSAMQCNYSSALAIADVAWYGVINVV